MMVNLSNTDLMKGYVWYHDKIYGGTKEEYLKFCENHDNVEVVMTLHDTTPDKIKIIADNLNNSNFIKQLQDRDKKG